MGFTDSFKKVIGLAEGEEEEILTDEEVMAEKKKIEREAKTEKETSSSYTSGKSSRGAQVYSSPAKSGEKRFSVANSNSLKLILIEPNSFDECPKLVDSLKSRKPIIINLEKLETETARKIFDFLSGATYALDGNVQKIANNIFIFTPDNVSVAAQQQAQSISVEPDAQNPWR